MKIQIIGLISPPGVTCRETVTISVTDISLPSGNKNQSFCDSATISDLVITGQNIQWYDSSSGGNLLDSSTSLSNGQVVYASQTVDGCESESRLAVTVTIQVNELTASTTEICTGESVDLSVTSAAGSTVSWSSGNTTSYPQMEIII